MEELKIFNNDEFGEIRTVVIDGEPWFVGKDVCSAFGDTNHNRTLSRVEEEDKKIVEIKDSLGRKQNTIAVNESGLYSVLFSMQPQKANNGGVSDAYPIEVQERINKVKKFKHWVTSEVLPAIRKHGLYAVDALLNDPDLAIKAFTALKEEREKNKVLQEENERMKPKEIFADAVSASDSSILVRELAKIIKQNGVPLGERRFYTWLRENGYICKTGREPTQRAMELGLFEVIIRTVERGNGFPIETKTTKVTGKGQQYFINKFLDKERAAG